MAFDLAAIGAHKVKSVQDGQSVELQSFWQNESMAIFFFRRWGCMLCRLWAKELKAIAPVLKQRNIKMIGVGVEELGSKEFARGNYFDGDLYYVENLKTYESLSFKRFNTFTILASLFWKRSREAIWRGRAMGLGGDMKGDKVQTGGALLVQKGGNLLLHFVQEGPADHLPNYEILKAFGLELEYLPHMGNGSRDDDLQCALFTFIMVNVFLSCIVPGALGYGKYDQLRPDEKSDSMDSEFDPQQRDIVDRADHAIQYLPGMLINTDSEITGLQVSENDDGTVNFALAKLVLVDKPKLGSENFDERFRKLRRNLIAKMDKSVAEISKVKVGDLDPKKFNTWKFRIFMVLKGLPGAKDVLEGKTPRPALLVNASIEDKERFAYDQEACSELSLLL